MGHFIAFSIVISWIYGHFFPIYKITEVLIILTLKLRITDIPLSIIAITEVSVTLWMVGNTAIRVF